MKTYSQAPLPFQGQKRRFLKPFKEALKEFSSSATYVDLFGGSGFLSHSVKSFYPNATVIYNDFDNYSQRLDNIDKTNALLSDLRAIVGNSTAKHRSISNELKTKIIQRIDKEKGFIDWIVVSSNLLFSMNYVMNLEEFKKEKFYNTLRMNNYNALGYLEGVNRVRKDYRELFTEYKKTENVVFLIDPPYLSTDTSTYSREDFWKLSDYLNVLKCLEDTSYFYFTSNKSQIIELSEWMQNNGYCHSPFDGITTIKVSTSLNYHASYEDIMIYRNNE